MTIGMWCVSDQVLGCDLRWSKILDLAEIAPQRRERDILIATLAGADDLNPHVCTVWPKVHPPSIRQFDVLTAASGHWLDECRPSDEVLNMYQDPSNLPPVANSQRQTKMSKVDVVEYRLRSSEDQFSCIMANYGEGHNLPMPTVRAGSLYGPFWHCLLASGLQAPLRFCFCRSLSTQCGSK